MSEGVSPMQEVAPGPAWRFPRPDLAEFFRTYVILNFDVDDAEQRVVFTTNLGSEHYNLWGMDLTGPSTYPYPLSHQNEVAHDVRLDPQGRYILASFDHDGDELTALCLVPPGGGALQQLVAADGHRMMLPLLSDDGNRVYYSTDREDPQHLSVHCRDLATGVEHRLLQGEGAPTVMAVVSPDESSFVVVKSYVNTNQPAFLMTPAGELSPLVPDPSVPYRLLDGAYLSPDEVVFTTNYQSEKAYVAQYSRQTGQFRPVARFAHDAAHLAVHRASGTAYVVTQEGVSDVLHRCEMASGATATEPLPVSIVEGLLVKPSGTLYLLGRSDIEPLNLWRRRAGGEWERLTSNRVMGMTPDQLVPAEVVSFRADDGTPIEALWFAARPEVANGYTIVWPHGGPQSAERKMFRAFFQFALARGYSVWAPNFRGSTGYGADFMQRVNRDWGGAPRRDVLTSIDWLVETGRADPQKLFCVGGSYGGYMTLLLHGRHPERFEAYVDIFGPSNLATFANSAPAFWKPMMTQWLGDPSDPDDLARLMADSPITYVDQMTKPMLVIQGANDPRVVKAESDQVVAALRERGVPVEYLVFPDEGHGFMHKANEIAAYSHAIQFLDAQRIRAAGDSDVR